MGVGVAIGVWSAPLDPEEETWGLLGSIAVQQINQEPYVPNE